MLYKYNDSMLDLCVDIFYNIYTGEDFGYSFLTKDNIREYFKDITSKADFEGFVFLQNKKILAMCFGVSKISFGNKLYDINEICVKSDYQGNGFGTRFLESIEIYLKKTGFKSISLNTRRDVVAYEFYKKNKYKEKENVVSMIKML